MKHSLKRLLALTLALVLALSLAACSKGEDEGDGNFSPDGAGKSPDPADIAASSPGEDPLAYMTAAAEVTAADLARRYAGSPAAALRDVMGPSGQLDASFSFTDGDGMGASAALALAYDSDAVRLDATINVEDLMEMAGSVYLSRDFVGVQVPMVFGDETFYGLRPYDLYDQVSGSVLAQEMDDSALEAFKQIDEVLDILSDIKLPQGEAMEKLGDDIAKALTDGVEFAAEEYAGQRDGQDAQGWKISFVLDSEHMADAMETYTDALMSGVNREALDRLYDMLYGSIDGMESFRGPDPDFSELRSSGTSCKFDVFVLDGRVSGFVMTPVSDEGDQGSLVMDFYNNGNITANVTSDGESVSFESAVSGGNGYTHVLTVTAGGETATLTTVWDSSGRLTLDMGSPEGSAAFSTVLDVESDGFSLAGLTVTAQGETLEIPLAVSYTPGVSPEAPASTKNIFDLTEEDYAYLAELFDPYSDI